MTTLKQLFQVFGHDPKWGRLATQSAQPMVSVFMRKLGDTDITTLTDFDIEMQLAMSEQAEDRKVKEPFVYALPAAMGTGAGQGGAADSAPVRDKGTGNQKRERQCRN